MEKMLKKLAFLLAATLLVAGTFISCSDDEEPTETTMYTVTFDSKGGSEVAPQSVESGKTASKPANDPTKSGVIFGGWYKGEEPFSFSTAITGSITLTAKWISEQYTNGGSVTLTFYDDKTFEYKDADGTSRGTYTKSDDGKKIEATFTGGNKSGNMEVDTSGDTPAVKENGTEVDGFKQVEEPTNQNTQDNKDDSTGDESSSGPSADETLPNPSGTDPFKSGWYIMEGKWRVFAPAIVVDDFIKLDTDTRTMEMSYEKEIYIRSTQFKYTYNETEKSVTLALSKVAFPTDLSKYIEYCVGNSDETGGYTLRLGSFAEYKNAYEELLTALLEHPDFENWWDDNMENDAEESNLSKEEKAAVTQQMIDEQISEYKGAFETQLVYTYTVNKDGSIKLTLTNPAPIDESQSTTLQFAE